MLDLLSTDGMEPGLGELSQRLNLHRSTTHRILKVLEHYRYVERDYSSGGYRLGAKVLELARKVVVQTDLIHQSRPYLRQIVTETGETSHLGVLRQGLVLSLANVESPRTVRTPATVGGATPFHCTSLGKVILAHSPGPEIDDLITAYGLKRYTRNTITRPDQFRAELRRVRQFGYAEDNEEFEEGLRCIGAPVWDHSGKVVAALSVTGPAFRLTQERTSVLIKSVLKAAHGLSVVLGYRAEASGRTGPAPSWQNPVAVARGTRGGATAPSGGPRKRKSS